MDDAMMNLIVGFWIGYVVRASLHWWDNYKIRKVVGEIRDSMDVAKKRHSEFMEYVAKIKAGATDGKTNKSKSA